MTKYRPNVAGIFQRPDGTIFVAERIGVKSAWQFPQGGVDPGEDHLGAFHREMKEEIGLSPSRYRIEAIRTGYRYKFPEGHLKKGIWCGQEQVYFLCRFEGSNDEIKLDAVTPEFSRFRWIMPQDFRLKWLPGFKRTVYRNVFKDFFSVSLSLPKS